MSFLDEYKRLAESETDNEFPEQMEHDGLTESDREMYEAVLSKMRADMDKANEDMRNNAGGLGSVCDVTGTEITNRTYKRTDEMLRQAQSITVSNYGTGKAFAVSEPIGLTVDGFRCPKCGTLMYEIGGKFVCPSCGYEENTEGRHMWFNFVDNKYRKTPFPAEVNDTFIQMYARGNKQNKNR